jgi:putative tricarboxylic transport membrane protein
MTLSKNRIGGLLFLLLSIAYGYSALDIALFPGEELEPVSARTFPYALAFLGAICSFALIVFDRGDESIDDGMAGELHWQLAAGLLLLMIGYGLALEWLGFLIATILFLTSGFWMLGERRPKILLAVAIPFTLGFWALLTQALDIYLAPGLLLNALGD